MIINSSGGGASLNYKVVGGTSQPTSASENTIWVNTNARITSHVFSATAPSNPTGGMIWFVTGKSSSTSFNALKKNGIWVYPAGCYLYNYDHWESKDAKVYQNGAWKDFSPFPLRLIPIFSAEKSKWTFENIGNNVGGSITNEGWLFLACTNENYATADYTEPIDMTTAGEVVYTYSTVYSNVTPVLDLISVETGAVDYTITPTESGASDKIFTVTLDVSTATGYYYLHFRTNQKVYPKECCVKSFDITRRS